ncbi:MAG: DNA replication/repair protein RecF [Candidatus Geothermincolia bacterium]
MKLSRLELTNFRNYERQEIEFSEGRNVIIGRNAQGKSNLLESVYFLSHLRSSRAPRLRELVKDGEERSAVRGLVQDGGDRLNIKISFAAQGRSFEVNGQKIQGAARARGILKCVLFAPEDLYLVKGDPARRREYFDETMEELGPVPANTVQQYRHVLRQRNALLRKWEEQANLPESLAPWNEALIKAGAAMTVERLNALEGITDLLREAYRAISGDEKDLTLQYKGTFEASPHEVASAEDAMRDALAGSAATEKRARATLVGPHREDVEIMLGGLGARYAASQGEQRTIAFCLRVAQKNYLREETGKAPVLLLDDVLSELDEKRRHTVLEMAGADTQAIITATELPPTMEGQVDRLMVIDEGKVTVA